MKIKYFIIILDFRIILLYSSYILSILETASIGNVSLAKLLSAPSQVLSREREIQKTRDIKEDFSSKIHDVSEKLKAISAKFKEKSPDVDHAKDEVKVRELKVIVITVSTVTMKLHLVRKLGINTVSLFYFYIQSLAEDLDSCGRSLSELEAAIQEFGRRNPLLAKQLSDTTSKLSEIHHHTSRLADARNNWLKKVSAGQCDEHFISRELNRCELKSRRGMAALI